MKTWSVIPYGWSSVCASPPLPSYILYWKNTCSWVCLRQLRHTGKHTTKDTQICLSLHLWSSEKSQQQREGENLILTLPLIVLFASGDRTMPESTAGQNSCLYQWWREMYLSQRKNAWGKRSRNREKSGKVAWIPKRKQKQSSGEISRGRRSLKERVWQTPWYKLKPNDGERRAEWEKVDHVPFTRKELAYRQIRKQRKRPSTDKKD